MVVKGDNLINKLILLFVFDKMEVPLSLSSIEEMCSQENNWLSFMDCSLTLNMLLDNSFVCQIDVDKNNTLYSITPNGRVCLADFFFNIPTSVREDISKFVKKNATKYRKKQEYKADYSMNKDGTYTVLLKIMEPVGAQLELKVVVPSRQIAKNIYKKWEDKAEGLYTAIYEQLVD